MLAASCAGKGVSNGSGQGTGGQATGGAAGAAEYGTSACGTCVEKTACASQLNACAADPGCAGYLDCLDKCPLGPTGDADPTCEKACPAVTSSAGQAAQSAFVDCRTSGPGTMCTGCGQIPKPTDPDFTQVCTPMMDTTPCYTCEDDHCCKSQATCANDASCQNLKMCLKGCGDSSCLDQCYMAAPTTAFSEIQDLLSCVTYHCSDTCGMTTDPCVKCNNVYCADEYAACDRDLQCTLLNDCEALCAPTDAACSTACEAKFPAGKPLLQAWQDCGTAHCSIPCGGS